MICGRYVAKNVDWEEMAIVARERIGEISVAQLKEAAYFSLYQGRDFSDFLGHPAIQILRGATGMMVIKRKVFENFMRAFPLQKFVWLEKEYFAFFHAGIDRRPNGDGFYLGEDYWFCDRVREMGMRIWLAPWMQLKHHGSFAFGAS